MSTHATFTAPLSVITHDILATRPASRWVAAGEVGCVSFIATTPHDWRFAALQAVHELVEAILHKHERVTQAAIDDGDLRALVSERAALDYAHACGASWEAGLALRLGVSPLAHANATHGLRDVTASALTRQSRERTVSMPT